MQERVKGFTLTEVLLVTVLIAIISIGLYSAFSNGVRLWKRVNEKVLAEDVSLLFTQMSRDLDNGFAYSGIGFEGNADGFSFPTMITYRTDEGAASGIGRVRYCFDGKEKGLYRGQATYSEVYERKEGRARRAVSDVISARFQYYCYDGENDAYLWVSEWVEYGVPEGVDPIKRVPLAVKVEMELEDDGETREITGVFAIPAGG